MSGRPVRTSRSYRGNGDRGCGGQGQTCNVSENRQLECGNFAQSTQFRHVNLCGRHEQSNRGCKASIQNTGKVPSMELLNIFCSNRSRGSQGISRELGNIFSSNVSVPSQRVVSNVSTRTSANMQKTCNALSIRRSSSNYRSHANTCTVRGRYSHTNENAPARDRYGRLIPNKFGNIVLSGDSDIESCNDEMSKMKEKQIVTPFQDQNAEPLTLSASSSASPITSLRTNSNEDRIKTYGKLSFTKRDKNQVMVEH